MVGTNRRGPESIFQGLERIAAYDHRVPDPVDSSHPGRVHGLATRALLSVGSRPMFDVDR
eukprot:3700919-Pyramimonas_sp.AAC.2